LALPQTEPVQIGGLADQVEGAEGFPDVTGIGRKIGQWIAGFDGTAVAGVEFSNFSRNGRPDFEIADAGDERTRVHIIAQLQPGTQVCQNPGQDPDKTTKPVTHRLRVSIFLPKCKG
jgi:hypothetical protein